MNRCLTFSSLEGNEVCFAHSSACWEVKDPASTQVWKTTFPLCHNMAQVVTWGDRTNLTDNTHLFPSSHKAIDVILGDTSPWAHLMTSQRLHIYTPLKWQLNFNMSFKGKHSNYSKRSSTSVVTVIGMVKGSILQECISVLKEHLNMWSKNW